MVASVISMAAGNVFEADEIKKVGIVLGVQASDIGSHKRLQNALEKAAFYFTLSMEKRAEQITPSEGARKMKRLRKKADSLHKEVLNLDRPILGSRFIARRVVPGVCFDLAALSPKVGVAFSTANH